MKRMLCMLLFAAMVLSLFAGCTSKQDKEVTCQEVIAAYQEAGYTVYHRDYPEKEYGYLCCIEIESEDGDHISFNFFDTDKEAEAYAEERQWNWALWLYTAAMFQPTWLTTETYGSIEIEYDDDDLYKPFKELVR